MNEIYEAIVKHLEDFFIIVDKKGFIKGWTKRAEEKLKIEKGRGTHIEEIKALTPVDILPMPLKFSEIIVNTEIVLLLVPYLSRMYLFYTLGKRRQI